MKKYLSLIIILFAYISLPGQEKVILKNEEPVIEKSAIKPQKRSPKTTPSYENVSPKDVRGRKKRIPDSMQPDYLNFQAGFAANVLETVGVNLTLTFEKKIENKPLAWFANYTFGFVEAESNADSYDHVYNENTDYFVYTNKDTELLSISYHHFGGGLHYYFRDYDRKLKLYTGIGGFIGVNHHEIEFDTDGSMEGNGLDLGVYGIFGIRWCRRHVKVGFEYRVGYAQTTLFDDAKSGDMHELSFCIGVQF